MKILLRASDKSLMYDRTTNPQWAINKATCPKPPNTKPSAGTKSKGLVVLLYIKDLSEALRRIFISHGIATCFKPTTTLRHILVAPKDKTPKEKKCGVIYHIPCQGKNNRGPCQETYIGETERSLKARFQEHTRPSSASSEVSQHIHIESPGHHVSLDTVRILDTEQDYFLRGVKEAIYIRAHHPTLNRDGGRHRLPDTFDPVLTSHFKEATWQASLGQSTEEDQSDWLKALGERIFVLDQKF
ncbi:hypothetical protein Bbelb_054210 [Branchiostoma belcheri]|nr:hypothetical protein Bbelb_054210 [Branchiostoma belcheri]